MSIHLRSDNFRIVQAEEAGRVLLGKAGCSSIEITVGGFGKDSAKHHEGPKTGIS